MNTSWSRIILIGVTAALAAVTLAQMPGDLVVTPTRVVLDDKSRSGDITLVNRSSQTVRYRLSLIDMEMSEDGMLIRTQSDENSAASILRLSPREIVLEPGVSQRIKIAAYFPTGMADRELRSHLEFEPISTPRSRTADPGTTFKLSLELRSIVTIPVIARHGRLFAEASISDAKLITDATGSAVQFKISRTGTRSIRGDIDLTFQPASGGAKVLLGHVEALPVYFPNADRIVTIRLKRDVSSLGKGEIQISFVEPERSRGAAAARSAVQLMG